jgi:transposase
MLKASCYNLHPSPYRRHEHSHSVLGGNAVNAIQRYELIRPILRHEKTPKQVSEETNIPISTIYRYLKRYREGSEDIESLAAKSHANQSHPKWLAREDKDKIVQYKLHHPYLSARQIAIGLAKEGILQTNYHSVADILKEHDLTAPFFSTNHPN